jgi:hypothetical protein
MGKSLEKFGKYKLPSGRLFSKSMQSGLKIAIHVLKQWRSQGPNLGGRIFMAFEMRAPKAR